MLHIDVLKSLCPVSLSLSSAN